MIPSNATLVSAIQAMPNWGKADDNGTSGTANGATSVVDTPTVTGQSREFDTSFTNAGGERYYVSFGKDEAATHFLYDVWVYVKGSSTIANLEMDMNQVTSNGQTVIYGFQCDGYSKTWDYTTNTGTPENYKVAWGHSDAACDVTAWSAESWHHVQVLYWRDDAGNVTYGSVWLDGAEQDINVTVPSSFALGWGSTLLTNFQVDGMGANGSSTVYMDELQVYRW